MDLASQALQPYKAQALPSGLLPDAVKANPDYRAAKFAYDAAFANLRAYNTQFMRLHGKQYRAAIAKAREGK